MSTPRRKMRTIAMALSRSDPAPQPGARECRRSTRGGSPCAEQRSRVCSAVHSATYSTDCEQGEKGLPPSMRGGRRRRKGVGAGGNHMGGTCFAKTQKAGSLPQGCLMALPTTESPGGNQSREKEGGTSGSRLRLSAVKLP